MEVRKYYRRDRLLSGLAHVIEFVDHLITEQFDRVNWDVLKFKTGLRWASPWVALVLGSSPNTDLFLSSRMASRDVSSYGLAECCAASF